MYTSGLYCWCMQLGGPSWTVPLGRRDATTASASLANSDLPGPTANLNGLLNAFANKGLSTTDMVALSGTVHARSSAHACFTLAMHPIGFLLFCIVQRRYQIDS